MSQRQAFSRMHHLVCRFAAGRMSRHAYIDEMSDLRYRLLGQERWAVKPIAVLPKRVS